MRVAGGKSRVPRTKRLAGLGTRDARRLCRTMVRMIAKDLLEILVCPACKQALDYRESPESLKCTACHRVYAVKDDIPIMLVDQATIETS